VKFFSFLCSLQRVQTRRSSFVFAGFCGRLFPIYLGTALCLPTIQRCTVDALISTFMLPHPSMDNSPAGLPSTFQKCFFDPHRTGYLSCRLPAFLRPTPSNGRPILVLPTLRSCGTCWHVLAALARSLLLDRQVPRGVPICKEPCNIRHRTGLTSSFVPGAPRLPPVREPARHERDAQVHPPVCDPLPLCSGERRVSGLHVPC
jgi:hypothetical protein